jgi:uncharacterized protein (TIGR03435 family)
MRYALVFGLVVLLSMPLITAAQTQPLAFEVASIKRHVGANEGVGISISGSRFTATNNSVLSLITYAYNVRFYQVTGGPTWASDYASWGWDIMAKAEGDDVLPTEEARQMLQRLFANRFQLMIHREMKEMPVYALEVAKKDQNNSGGKSLKESAPDATFSMRVGFNQGGQITATKSSMERLANQLSGGLERPVLDHTGLSGDYDFKLEWSSSNAANPDAPTIFTALQEQLGLKLESIKAPIEVVVIDSVSKPSEN